MVIDAVAVFTAYLLCLYFSRAFIVGGLMNIYWKTILIALPVYLAVMFLFGVYGSLWRYAQSKEFFICISASITSGALFFTICRLVGLVLPLFLYLLFMCTTALALVSIRLLYRMLMDFRHGHQNHDVVTEPFKRALIVGGGAACVMLLNEIKANPSAHIKPVAIVDDDEQKQGKRISDVRIVGTCNDIVQVCEKYRITNIIIALPSASNARRSELLDICAKTTCVVKITPRLYESNDRAGILNRLRDITADELLGRDPVEVADAEMLSFIKDKTFMVTGGGGSIGSELCRQIALYAPKRLIIVDIFENNAYNIQQELVRKYGSTLDLVVLIASVRDYGTIDRLMRNYKPDIVIHAAAHKHVPLMETSPCEAIKNNIFGTYNTARAAKNNGVSKFIMISTDKAVNPTNIMGASKRACEMIVQSMNEQGVKTQFAAVRFGNVLGSSGSVIPLFKQQILEGGPVTVTHPEIVRFFMTIPEATQLVLTAGAMAKGGEIFVLDMGKETSILELAKKMIRLSGLRVDKDIKIEFTGLRPGEKLYEELLMSEEGLRTTDNNKIFVGKQIDVDSELLFNKLQEMKQFTSENEMTEVEEAERSERILMDLVPTFKRAE
ncbi:MAG TPA: nucleoside-diphosphate sugar epimerase/dehydratase [Bacillota bacterium]|nr:nucleoside-diphosphate sugar epimerase/dehydratase [Bacillota bacterium]